MQHLKWPLAIAALLIFTLLVEYLIGWQQIFSPWQTLPLFQVVLASLLLFTTYLIRAGRLIHFFKLTSLSQMLGCARLMLVHNFWNNLLPMRTGEASFPILMQTQFKIGLAQSLPALLWFRLLDLHSLLLIVLIAVASFWLGPIEILVLSLFWMAMPILFYRLQGPISQKLNPNHKVGGLVTKLINGLPQNSNQFLWSWIWTLINWTLKLVVLAWILSWFIPLLPSNALLGAAGGELSSVLPIHGIGGFGTYEAGVWLTLSQTGLEQAEVWSAAINLHLLLISTSIFSVLFAYILPKQ